MFMHEQSAIKAHGFPGKIARENMKTFGSRCSNCGQRYLFEPRERRPDRCYFCGHSAFETEQSEPANV